MQEKAKLETLPFFSPQWGSLAKDLLGRKCSEEADGVCCRTEFEIVGGTVVEQVEDFPFVARIVFKTSFSTRGFCGASLIHPRLLLTAKHCVGPFFWEWCLDESDCYAYFRDLVPGRTNFEKGEFTIPLVDMFEKEGTSDLAIVKLGFAVSRIKELLCNTLYKKNTIRKKKHNMQKTQNTKNTICKKTKYKKHNTKTQYQG